MIPDFLKITKPHDVQNITGMWSACPCSESSYFSASTTGRGITATKWISWQAWDKTATAMLEGQATAPTSQERLQELVRLGNCRGQSIEKPNPDT